MPVRVSSACPRIFGRAILALTVMAGAASPTCAGVDQAETILRKARAAYDEGDYRRADDLLGRVDSLLDSSDREAGIAAWDLRTEVLWASGRLQDSLTAAERHLAAVREAYQTYGNDLAEPMQDTLVRKALIGRTLFEAQSSAKRSQVTVDKTLLRGSARSLREALTISASVREDDPLWKPETLLELALVQDLSGADGDATPLFNLAAAQLRRVAEDDSRPDRAVRAIRVLSDAHPHDNAESNRQRALEAQGLADAALASERFAPAERFELLTLIAQSARQLEDVERETAALQAALQIRRGDDHEANVDNGKLMVRLAMLAARQSGGAAESWYRKAATSYQTLLAELRGQDQTLGERVEYLQQLQLIYTRLEAWDQAIAVVERLLEIRDRLLVDDDPNRFRTISALGSLHTKAARSAQSQNNYTSLREHARQGETALKRAASFWRSFALADGVELATTLNNLAELARYDGQFRQASALLDEAAPLQEATTSPGDVSRAEFHANRAAVFAALGQFEPAESYYERALEASRRNQTDQRRRRERLAATTLLNLAQLYKSQRSFDKALQRCDEALDAAKLAWPDENAVDRVPFMLAATSLLVAQWQTNTERDSLLAAVDRAERALKILTGAGLGLSLQAATANHLSAIAWYRLGKRDRAVAKWQSVVKDYDRPETSVVVVRALNYLVEIELVNSQRFRNRARTASDRADFDRSQVASTVSLDAALRYSERAQTMSQSIAAYPAAQFVTRLRRAQTLRAQSHVLRARDQLEQAQTSRQAAIDSLGKAIDGIERPRTMVIGAGEERAEYFSQFAVGFDLLVDLLVEQGDYESAIKISERRRSRTFLDQMRASGVDPRATLPAESQDLLEKEQATLDRYYETSKRLLDENIDRDERAQSIDEARQLRNRWQEINNEIISSSRAFRQLIHSSTSEGVAAAGGVIDDAALVDSLDVGAMALVFHVGARNSYLFVIGHGQPIRCIPLRLSTEQATKLDARQGSLSAKLAVELVNLVLRGIVGGAYTEIRGGSSVPVQALKQNDETLVNITDVLLPRAARDIVLAEAPRYLLIIPDGALHQLPLEALMLDSQQQRYVLDDFPATCYAPSLAVFRLLSEETTTARSELQVLTVGDPIYRQQSADVARQLTGVVGNDFLSLGGSLARLPGTADECVEVRRAFQDGATRAEVTELVRENAAEKQVRADLAGKHIIHLAAHGLVDQQANNLFGAIALSTPEQPTPEDDGFFSLYEIYLSPLQSCELAILSACETNCGPQRPLEAGSTLARAFLCAGARRVVCSHWSVDDTKTPILIKSFVDQVARGMRDGTVVDFAGALHQARRKLRANADTADPQYWAAFVLIGPPYSSSR